MHWGGLKSTASPTCKTLHTCCAARCLLLSAGSHLLFCILFGLLLVLLPFLLLLLLVPLGPVGLPLTTALQRSCNVDVGHEVQNIASEQHCSRGMWPWAPSPRRRLAATPAGPGCCTAVTAMPRSCSCNTITTCRATQTWQCQARCTSACATAFSLKSRLVARRAVCIRLHLPANTRCVAWVRAVQRTCSGWLVHESATPDGSLREVHGALQVCAHRP